MRARPEVVPPGRTPRVREPVLLFAALWAYALTFGVLALAGIRLLDGFVATSRFDTVFELAVMACATLAGTYLSIPALKIAGRHWGEGWMMPERQPVPPAHITAEPGSRLGRGTVA